VNARIRDEVGLEVGKIDVEGTIKAEGGGDRRNDFVQSQLGSEVEQQISLLPCAMRRFKFS
jgi:hypothetical protein